MMISPKLDYTKIPLRMVGLLGSPNIIERDFRAFCASAVRNRRISPSLFEGGNLSF